MKQFYHMAVTSVVYGKDGIERNRTFNIMLTTENPFINRRALTAFQQQAHGLFYSEFDKTQQFQIKTVHILNIIPLGEMTEEEFHKGFEDQLAEMRAAQAAAEDAGLGPDETPANDDGNGDTQS